MGGLSDRRRDLGGLFSLAIRGDRSKLLSRFMNFISYKAFVLAGVFVFSGALLVSAQEQSAKSAGRLKFETAVTREDLKTVNSVELSGDGRFLYATPWQMGAVVVFQ